MNVNRRLKNDIVEFDMDFQVLCFMVRSTKLSVMALTTIDNEKDITYNKNFILFSGLNINLEFLTWCMVAWSARLYRRGSSTPEPPVPSEVWLPASDLEVTSLCRRSLFCFKFNISFWNTYCFFLIMNGQQFYIFVGLWYNVNSMVLVYKVKLIEQIWALFWPLVGHQKSFKLLYYLHNKQNFIIIKYMDKIILRRFTNFMFGINNIT